MSRRLTKQLNMVVAVTNELARLNKLAVEVDGWHHVTRRGAPDRSRCSRIAIAVESYGSDDAEGTVANTVAICSRRKKSRVTSTGLTRPLPPKRGLLSRAKISSVRRHFWQSANFLEVRCNSGFAVLNRILEDSPHRLVASGRAMAATAREAIQRPDQRVPDLISDGI